MHLCGTGGALGHCLFCKKPFLHSITIAHDASVSFSPWDNLSPSYEQLLSGEGKGLSFPRILIRVSYFFLALNCFDKEGLR